MGGSRRCGRAREFWPGLADVARRQAVLWLWWVGVGDSAYDLGVGSVQFMTGMYVTELAPSRIRGFLLIFYSFWWVIQRHCDLIIGMAWDNCAPRWHSRS
mgnify:CR=1 FL=1